MTGTVDEACLGGGPWECIECGERVEGVDAKREHLREEHGVPTR